MVRVGADTSEAEAGLKRVGDSIGKTAKSMALTGAGMTAAFTAPFVAVAKGALTMAADFETSMNLMAVAGDIPAASMAHLERQALDLGASTVFSAGEVATGMLELTKAGMDMFETSAAIQGVTELAAAGGMELGDAANIATQYLNAFNLEAEKSAEIANLLAGGANASSADLTDLSLGGVQAAGSFARMDLTASDLITSLAILSNVGMDASKGGTNLNQMMQDLAQPTIKARKSMKRLGIELFDVDGNFIGMTETLDEFSAATKNMTMEQREMSLGMIFSGEGLRAMTALVDQGSAGFSEMQSEVERGGQAAALADARMSGLAGAMDYLSGSVDSFLIGAAKPFLKMGADLLRWVADMITEIGALPAPIRNAALAFMTVLAAAGPIVGVAAAIAGAFALLGTAAAPILLVTAAVAGLAAVVAGLTTAGIINWATVWDTVKASVQGAIDTVQAWKTQIQTQGLISEESFIASWELPAGAGEIVRFLQGVGAAVKVLSNAVSGGDLGAGKLGELNRILSGAFGSEIATRIQNIAGHIKTLKETLAGATTIGEWMRGLGTFGKGMGTEIGGIAKEITTQIKQKIDFELTIGENNIRAEFDRLGIEIGESISGMFLSIRQRLFLPVLAAQLMIQDAFSGGDTTVWDRAVTQIQTLMSGIREAFAGFETMTGGAQFMAFTNSLAMAFATIQSIKLDVLTTATSTLTTFLSGILNFAAMVVSSLDASVIADTLTTAVQSVSDTIQTIANAENLGKIGTAIGTLVSSIIGKLTELLSEPGFADDVGTAVGNATTALAGGAFELVEGIMKELSLVKINDFASSLSTFVFNFLGGLATKLATADYGAVAQSIVEGLSGAVADWMEMRQDIGTLTPEQIAAAKKDLETPGPLRQFLSEWWAPITEPQQAIGRRRATEIMPPGEPILVPVTPQWPSPDEMYGAPTRPGRATATIPVPVEPIFGPMREALPTMWEFPTMQEMMDRIKAEQPTAAAQEIQMNAVIMEAVASPTLKPIEVKAVYSAAEQMPLAGDALTKGASAISSTLSGFSWPDMPDWTWPDLPPFSWPDYTPWKWPPVPQPDWLNRLVVPRPSWLGELLSWSPQVRITQQAITTPGQISTTTTSSGEGQAGTASMPAVVQITGDVYIRDELDLETLAYRISQIQNSRG